jgi:hypothetical protein
MSQAQHTPVVPLEAGAGPENPPCPACGEPLFGWIAARPGLGGAVSRCESCGLGVVNPPGDTEDALRELIPGSAVPLPHIERKRNSGSIGVLNRASFSASLGGAGWAGLEPGSRYLFTVESVRRLVASRDQIVRGSRWSPGAGIATMWQTLLNSVTFGRNVALGALGRRSAARADKRWQRRIDGLISVVLAVPAMALALPLELAGAALRRGSTLKLRLQLL